MNTVPGLCHAQIDKAGKDGKKQTQAYYGHWYITNVKRQKEWVQIASSSKIGQCNQTCKQSLRDFETILITLTPGRRPKSSKVVLKRNL